jgi:hypothetical protein
LQYEKLKNLPQDESFENLPQDESFENLPLRNHELPQYWHFQVPLVHTDYTNLATKNQTSPKSGVPRVCVPISACMYVCTNLQKPKQLPPLKLQHETSKTA